MTKSSPLPGHKVRGSQTGRPIMALLDLLGRRWALRILWELCAGPRSFRDLQAACGGASPSVINTRLRELRDARLIGHQAGEGYQLTPHGIELAEFFIPISHWAERWSAQLEQP